MQNKKSTKRALILSTISLLLCLSMFVGTTFAWFTDSISSVKNRIVAGNLDVELYWSTDAENWEAVNDRTNVFEEDTLWEPGHTEVVYLKVANLGSLALKYQLGINVVNEEGSVNVNGDPFMLSEFIKFGVDESSADKYPYADRKAAVTAVNSVSTLISAGYSKSNTLESSKEEVVALVVYMPETVGNEANYNRVFDAPYIDLGITLVATQQTSESDSFGNGYDNNSQFSDVDLTTGITVPVTPDADNKVASQLSIMSSSSPVYATVPAGVQLEAGTTKMTLSVSEMANTNANISLEENEITRSLDVHISGVAEGNTVPMLITVPEAMMTGLNMGNYKLYHVENGTPVQMTYVSDSAQLDAHNEFTYDPATGDIVIAMASFSEVAVVADTENAWNGDFVYELKGSGSEADPIIISNADELAGFGAIVGGMNEQTQNSFTGKFIKLISDVNLGDAEDTNKSDIIFYPIGYYNSDGTYGKTNKAITSGFKTFEGTFDGNGHTIKNFYQNTWEMKGDHNWYDATLQYYRDGMGLFGKVYGGTVKNLTVDHFSSDGEIATTGVIAAYADCGATFENIAITNCNPRVYNIGNGGIVGCVGWYASETTDKKVTFTNITVDNSNKISALWGSYDVACGGIVGQYYPTSGQTNAVDNAGIALNNCHVSAQMDVYNDVCGNYQYYAYRYAGMLIGSIRENLPADANGHIYPDMSNISVNGCTVHFDSWNDYYYCELADNGKASYTHDHKMSRLEQVDSVDVENKTVTIGDITTAIPTSGRANYVVIKNKDENGKWIHGDGADYATCYHFKDGELWTHDMAGVQTGIDENGDGKDDLKEDKQLIYREFKQLFTGYGWGVTSKGLEEFDKVNVYHRDSTELVEKFEKNEALTGSFLYRVGNGNAFPIGKLFQAIDEALVVDSGVYVSVKSLVDGVTMYGTFKNNKDDWTQSTLQIMGGTGPAELTIQDYNNCMEFTIKVEVVDATNVTAYSELKNQNSVLLNDITMGSNGKFSLYDYKTLYGNGFTFDVTAGLDSDTEGGYVGGNGTVWVRNSTLDNVIIVGEVYTEYGGTVKAEYNFPTVLVLGDSVIANSYISNGCSPVRVGSGCNIEIINSTLEGGIFANLDIRGGTVKLQNVTTINQSTASGASISNDKNIVGLGVVVYTGSTVTIDATNLKQYNCISENASFTGEAKTLRDVIFGTNYTEYQFESENVTWVNTGIVSMVGEVGADNISTIDGYSGKSASIVGFNGYVYAPIGQKSVIAPGSYTSSGQYQIAPTYKFDYTSKNNVPQVSGSNDYCVYDESTQKYLISFDDGESFVWDANILSVMKGGNPIDFTVTVSGGATVNADNTIIFDTADDYTVTYSYSDSENYRLANNGEIEKYSAYYEKTVNITVYEVVDTSAKTEFAFGSNGFRSETANNLTYVMPDVNATVDSNTAGIGVTTVGGVNIYYPIVSMHKSGSSSWYNYFSVFEAVTITDLNGTVHNTSTTELPSGLTVIGGFILDANGNVSTAESANGTGIFNYSTGKEIKCYTYSTYGLCYYPDSQFTKTGTSDRAEQTIVVKYRYTDSNGTPYYYYVGYWCEEHTKSTICLTPDTLITLADGTQKEIQNIRVGDEVIAWNFYTGKYEIVPVSLLQTHSTGEQNVLHLYFEDGTELKLLGEHGVFDADLNTFVFIDENDVKNYVGHSFVKQNVDSFTTVKLVGYEVTTEYTTAYTILSDDHYNVIAEGMFTVTPAHVGDNFFNPFDVGEDMKYNEEEVKADIEKYGLYTYEDFDHVLTEEQYNALNLGHFKVSVGKGYITYEGLIYLIENFINNEDFNV